MSLTWTPPPRQFAAIKAAAFAACLLPLSRLGWGAWTDALGANPIELITRSLGTWTLSFLLVTLTVTPLRRLTGMNWLLRLRRMFGLFAFFYGCLHLTAYLWLDQFFDWTAIARDIVKRPFITVGFTAFVLMIPLAATSNSRMIRRLGGPRWQRLHRTVYAIAIFGVVHYWWLVKKDVTQPAIYALALAVLLGVRAVWLARERAARLPPGLSATRRPAPAPGRAGGRTGSA